MSGRGGGAGFKPARDSGTGPAVAVSGLSHRYGAVRAVRDVSLTIPRGVTAGLVGADGVGKSTLLSLIAGCRVIQEGRIEVFGRDMSRAAERAALSRRVAFMPQGLGRNLYPTLSVRENISFHADLFGLRGAAGAARIARLLAATALAPFEDRAAGKLSGGMKQKLSLCCALVHSPDLLILDEPTTGVDPLSRRQFWILVGALMRETPGMTVVVSTAYIEEAERFDRVIVMDEGRIIAAGETRALTRERGAATLEEAYMKILPPAKRGRAGGFKIPPYERKPGEAPAISASGLTRDFGSFRAVDGVSFEIGRGEIFGFIGSNGCGKSTTMKMLTGLLEPTAGEARVLGTPFRAGDAAMKRKVGYMSQSFSLYEELTVLENLYLHGKLYHIPIAERAAAIRRVLERFGLAGLGNATPKSLPLGLRQRLQLAAACLHDPEILILDEPTSGVDPAARDMFWESLIKLSREEKVTIFVSTHFMNEAERCDRVSLMHRGRVLATGSPEELKKSRGEASLEEVFVRCLEEEGGAGTVEPAAPGEDERGTDGNSLLGALTVIAAFAVREGRELLRDRVRLFFALFGALIFIVTASYGISFDMSRMPFAVLDHDGSPESRALVREFEGSAYLRRVDADLSADPVALFRTSHIKLLIDVPPRYGESLLRGERPEVGFLVDGAFNSVTNNVRGYVSGIMGRYNAGLAGGAARAAPDPVEVRFMYNEIFKSVYVMTPGLVMMVLTLFPAVMTALGVVREKDLGTISNLYTSPAAVWQFLIGKQIPYVILALASFLLMTACAVFVLGVPVRGSFAALALGALLMALASSSFGLLVSCFVRTQVAAIFAAAIFSMLPAINFSGFLFPASTLQGPGYYIAKIFPCSRFQLISLGTFTKGLGAESLIPMYAVIAGIALVYLALACLALKKQER